MPKKRKNKKSAEKKEDPRMAEARKWLDGLVEEDVIDRNLFEEKNIESLAKQFEANPPFPSAVLQNFLDDDFAKQLAEEIKNVQYFMKNNDLYQFVQSNDLNTCTKPLVSKFREVLYSAKFRTALQGICGLELKDQVDMFAAVYEDGNHLLPHDDQLSDRALAFILYLVPPGEEKAPEEERDPEVQQAKRRKKKKKKKTQEDKSPWSEADGGTLDFFTTDENGQAGELAVRTVPTWNSFAMFQVSARSYHQVAEVTSRKPRLTIGGWFHGRTPTAAPLWTRPMLPELPLASASSTVADWLNREYRKAKTIRKVKAHFCDESSIELQNLLRTDVYDELCAALLAQEDWTTVGPRNRCLYSSLAPAPVDEKKGVIDRFREFLVSTEFSAFLQTCTGLDAEAVTCQVRRFSPGNYSLTHDLHPDWKRTGVDATLCILDPAHAARWSTDHGGMVHYIMQGQTEELISIFPRKNTMSLVYHPEPGVLPFVKYISLRAPTSRFDFHCNFRCADDSDSD